MKINKRGVTRLVIEFDRVVIKIPNFTCQWSHFLIGLISNINESKTYKWHPRKDILCPVLWSSWGGWILIMKRANPCDAPDFSKWIENGLGGDDKPENYGIINGIVVKIDYGQI